MSSYYREGGGRERRERRERSSRGERENEGQKEVKEDGMRGGGRGAN